MAPTQSAKPGSVFHAPDAMIQPTPGLGVTALLHEPDQARDLIDFSNPQRRTLAKECAR